MPWNQEFYVDATLFRTQSVPGVIPLLEATVADLRTQPPSKIFKDYVFSTPPETPNRVLIRNLLFSVPNGRRLDYSECTSLVDDVLLAWQRRRAGSYLPTLNFKFVVWPYGKPRIEENVVTEGTVTAQRFYQDPTSTVETGQATSKRDIELPAGREVKP